MSDVTIGRLDELPALHGVFVRVGTALGVSSFGMNVERWEAGATQYPEHDERATGQEEVYVVLRGAATLRVGEQEHLLEPGVFARVGAAEWRKLLPGPDGVDVLCLGGIPGQPFEPSSPADA